MSVIHRPMPNDHCTCRKYMAGDWEGHKDDLLVLDPDAAWDSKPLSNFEFALRPFVERYINSLKEIGKAFRKMSEGLAVASDFKKTMDQVTLTPDAEKLDVLDSILEAKERYERTSDLELKGLWEIPDQELPGTWAKSDFEGGDPDERSYAQRCRDGDHLFTNFKDNDHTANQHLRCVYCGVRQGG